MRCAPVPAQRGYACTWQAAANFERSGASQLERGFAGGMATREVIGAGADSASRTIDVRLEGVTKRFDDVVAVADLSLSIERGRFFALLGPSGCGKTTTLRMIGGFEQPTAGTIYLGERDVTGLPPYRRNVNTVFQSYALFPHLSVRDNVGFGLREQGVKRGELAQRVNEAMELVGVAALAGRKPRQLSGGQQQRVALARALVCRPQVLLLDEPLGALDLKLRKQLQLELKRIQDEVGITFIHVTHDQEEAMTMADGIAVMNNGRIEQLGTPAELYEQPRTAFVAGFLGVSNLLSGLVAGDGLVRLDSGAQILVPPAALAGCTGRVGIGVRPEKIQFGAGEGNVLSGVVSEIAYIGVSYQFIVSTPEGAITVYTQNMDARARPAAPGEEVTLRWSPESTFVVDVAEEGVRDE
jgi:spermidine/putrescine transport system ATP-binding protein